MNVGWQFVNDGPLIPGSYPVTIVSYISTDLVQGLLMKRTWGRMC